MNTLAMEISSRAAQLTPSLTLSIDSKAKAMKAEGIDICGFGAGEPDFDTPEHIKAAAIAALEQGFTKYTPSSGLPELRQAISEKLAADNGLEYRPSQVIVSNGAKHACYNALLATCEPGDAIIVPPASIGGHVTHNRAGVAGLLGLDIHEMPIDAERYTVDLDGLAAMVERVRAKLITIGASLNLIAHPVGAIHEIADRVGARVLFDAAHVCGLIAGGAWPNPLAEGADIMTMSTYKSLGGPPAGLILTNEPELAERLDAIAYPGLTANFDAAKAAALAIALLDWKQHGRAYAAAMHETAMALASALDQRGVPVFARERGMTRSHQFAVEAALWGGGQALAKRLRRANILTCAFHETGIAVYEQDDDAPVDGVPGVYHAYWTQVFAMPLR